MPKTGRKSLKDELQIKQRYADLTEPFFKVLRKHLDSPSKADQQWAVEQLTKAFVKMIPTEVGGINGEPISITWETSLSPTHPDPGRTTST